MRQRLQLPLTATLILMATLISVTEKVTAEAIEKNGFDFPSAGVATVLSPSSFEIETPEQEIETKLNINEKFEAEEERMLYELTMTNVSNTLNVRSEPSEEAQKVGYLYRDCGGTILEQQDGWTKIQSGALTGWCSNEFLFFGDEAISLAEDVGQWLITTSESCEAVRIRKEPSSESDVLTVMSRADIADFVEIIDDQWVSVEFDGELGYVDAEYISISFHIDEGETMEAVQTRYEIEKQLKEAAEAEARAKLEAERAAAEKAARAGKTANSSQTQALDDPNNTINRGAVSANADELRLLAALIYCEAGNQSYEGKVGVGAVVMNRVKSPAYPNTIYSVIYASGQFTPAMSGKVAKVYESGAPDSCYQAAAAAINGETTVGGATHFRRNNGRAGIVIGAHVFY